MGVIAYWINDKWEYQEMLVGFEPLVGGHDTTHQADALMNVLT